VGLPGTRANSALGALQTGVPAPTRRPARRTLLTALAVLLSFGLLLAPSFYAAGGELDEGALVAYPVRVLEGAWPDRDFETFYGPGTTVLLAGAFWVVHPSVGVERAVGMAFKFIAIIAIFLLVVPWGIAMAALCALIAGVILQSDGVVADAMASAFALNLMGVALLTRCRGGSRPRALALIAGLLIGAATLFRPDFLLAGTLGSLPLLWKLGGDERRRWLAGVGAGLILLAIDAAVVGPAKDKLAIGDMLRSLPGRRVPLPVLLSANGLLMVLSAIGLLLLAALARPAVARRDPRLAATGLAMALFAAGFVSYFFSRAGLGHIVPLATVTIGLLPLALIAHGRVLAPTPTRWAARLVAPAATVVGLSGALLGGVALANRETIANLSGRGSIRSRNVDFDGRSFPVDARFAPELQVVVDAVPRFSHAGQRLFVGASDLRQSSYNDTFLYYLLPQLVPASYYMELDPQGANHGTRLASELTRADILILTSRHDVPHPTGALVGNTNAPAVVAKLFCVRFRYRTYELLTRCR
jgi:hypothetical protein